MLFYDFEVFRFDWLVVIADPVSKDTRVIVNNRDELFEYYNNHRDDIWVGFNSRHYDQYILKAILSGYDAYDMSSWIIENGWEGWKFADDLWKFSINNYDVMSSLDRGLKAFEGFMGNDMMESSIPFNINRKLTDAEIDETIKYCTHDVEQTMEVFIERRSDFEAQMGLLTMFNLPIKYINKTKVQLASIILEAEKHEYNDEFNISFPDSLRITKYTDVIDWYKNPQNRCYERNGKKVQYTREVAGVPHSFGWGGVHGAREKYSAEGYFINMDVASLYPSLMIKYNLHSRSCNPQKFNDIVATRLKYKKEKNPLQAPLKIVINGTYGAMKDKNNPLYDPRQANNVCVYGQLLLLDLIEKLEPHCDIIQSNTDGVLVKMPDGGNEDEFYSLIDDIAYEWESRTGLTLEFDEYIKVVQKDVNNYVIIDSNGKYKSKGAYVKKLSALDYDLPIVNKAVVEYILHGTHPSITIGKCDSLKEFQQVKKISNKYSHIIYNGVKINERCVRVFAVTSVQYGGLYKVHKERGTVAKMEGTPEHCVILNVDVNDAIVLPIIDKQWYINVAIKRLNDFGVL